MSDQSFSDVIGYAFRDSSLLLRALTHSSYVNETGQDYCMNNERLEFLGDAVFDAIISDHLYNRLDGVEEGHLTKLRAAIVCEASLAECAARLRVGEHLRLGKGEEHTGGRMRQSIIADAMEAIIGAVYLDGGWDKVKGFVLSAFKNTIEEAVAGKLNFDYKTALQERFQAHGEVLIQYKVVKEEGPDHDKTFFVTLSVDGKEIGFGSGHSKKEAEQKAARKAMESGGTDNVF